MSDDLEGAVNVEYEKMIGEFITGLYKDRIRALAQSKVIAKKYNEALAFNKELNAALLKLQEELSHKTKELEKLKKRSKTDVESEDISE